MTEPSPANAPKPAKRSFFKKSSWQTAAATTESNDDPTQMFSRAGESFKAIMAEEEQARKAKELRQQKKLQDEAEEAKTRKKRKSSEEPLSPRSGSSSKSSRLTRSLADSRSRSPTAHKQKSPKETLGVRSDDSAHRTSPKKHQNNVISLDDSDDPSSDFRAQIEADATLNENHTDLSHDADLNAEGNPNHEEDWPQDILSIRKTAPPTVPSGPEPVVEVLIVCYMDGMSKQLMIKIPYSMKFGKVKDVWIGHQKLPPDVAKTIILTYNNIKVYPYASARSLGITPENIEDKGQPILEATTEAGLVEAKERERKAHLKQSAVTSGDNSDDEPAKAEGPSIRLTLKSKDYAEYKLKVHPNTTFEKIANAVRKRWNVLGNQNITISFDGDILSPQQMISETEIEDPECLDVYVK